MIWEVWNELIIRFWKPKPNADDYTKLALETVKAVREADPKATILIPGSAGLVGVFRDLARDRHP